MAASVAGTADGQQQQAGEAKEPRSSVVGVARPRAACAAVADLFDTAAVEERAGAETVQVRLKHRISKVELLVSVPAEGATFRDLLLEAARVTGDESIVFAGRLVRPGQGQLIPYADSELIGKRRRLLFIGPPLRPPGAPADPAVSASEGAAAKEASRPSGAGATPVPSSARSPGAGAGSAARVAAQRLTRPRALGLLMELHAGFLNGKFQRRLKQMEHAHPKGSDEFRSVCGQLVSDVYLEVLPRYGVEATSAGVVALLREVDALGAGDPEFTKAARAIESILGTELSSLAVFEPSSEREADAKVKASALGAAAVRGGVASTVKPAPGGAAGAGGGGYPGGGGGALATPVRHRQVVPSVPPLAGTHVSTAFAQRALVPLALKEPTTPQLPAAASLEGATRASRSTRQVVLLRLQHSRDCERVAFEDGAVTITTLRERLWQEFGVPSRTALLVKTADGDWEPVSEESPSQPRSGQRTAKPTATPRRVLLKGVALLTRDSGIHWRSLLEDDAVRAVSELNARYAEAAFQDRVASWRSAPMKEAASRIHAFRDEVNIIVGHVIAKYGFEPSPRGLQEWEVAVEQFKKFPTFADCCRKSRVLLGTLSPEQARSMQRASAIPRIGVGVSLRQIVTTHQEGRLSVRTIPSEFALVAARHEAQSVLALLHARIYEENREKLWNGGNVPGHCMPTQQAMAQKYLEPVGALLLQCTGSSDTDVPVVGGAAVFPLSVRVPSSASMALGTASLSTMSGAVDSTGSRSGEGGTSDDDNDDDDDGQRSESSCGSEGHWAQRWVSACYVDAFAAVPGWRAGPAMMEHLEHLAKKEGWDMIILHSIKVKQTLAFWSRQGFHKFGEAAGTEFKFFCVQNFGFPMSRELIERQLPARPGCVLFAKAVHA